MLKTTPISKNQGNNQKNGLTYNTAIIGDLVNKDTDGDGVLDWEESLWGTDPTKKETTPEIPDNVAIEKLKTAQGMNVETNTNNQDTENLTETDKFSREFFSTVATLNQNGAMDQATADKLSSSLAERIQNSPPKKVYLLSDMKIIEDNSLQAIKNYNNTLDGIHKKYPTTLSIMDVLKEFSADENNVDASVLLKLNPIIEQVQGIINGMLQMNVPQSLASLHLDFINAFQMLSDNLKDIKLYDSDPIVALSAISQYDKNATVVESTALKLSNAIEQKLNN